MITRTIRNPIIPGFNPDPSICRVGDDYYIANSTFEWFPGVRIHHSRDLVHWRLLTHALDRTSQLDMRGVPPSCGIWAPCLSHDGDRFYLIYTVVHGVRWPVISTNNYLVTAESIDGPWSEPIAMNNSGIDPSLFHDRDGRKYLCNMYNNWDDGAGAFGGIVLQEYDHAAARLVGPVKKIWEGTSLNITEGPHLYRKGDWYYLLCAEGGTHFGHAASVARSRSVWGPFEVHPDNPMLTSRDKPHLRLQKAGHGSLVETPAGEWYFAHLAGRPLRNPEFGDGVASHRERMCILGRETALQKVMWGDDGWPRLAHGNSDPAVDVPAPALESHPWPQPKERISFAPERPLDMRLQTLREPADPSWCSLDARPGYLRLHGRNHLRICHEQSLVAMRVTDFHTVATTRVAVVPNTFKQMAGLAAYYDDHGYYYLRITASEKGNRTVGLMTCDNGRVGDWTGCETVLPDEGEVYLRFVLEAEWIRFFWSMDGERWQQVGPRLNATYLSDDAANNLRFTGLFAALCCQDLENRTTAADFAFLEVHGAR